MIDWNLVWTVVVAAGIPSALVGILIRRLNKRIDKRDAENEAKDAARIKNEAMLIKLSMASLSLGEATAQAVQRIPDAHCNGDMHKALEFAQTTKTEYREFEREQFVRSLNK